MLTGPYVLLTGPEKALIAFRNTSRENATVEWKTEQRGGSQAARRQGDRYWVNLTGLTRGDLITYVVKIGGLKAGEGSFRVGPAADDKSGRFAVFGDTRTNHQVHRAVIEALAKEKIDLFLHTGDMVERGGKPDQWVTFFQIERPLMAKAPILPAIGNHDIGNRGYYNSHFFLDKWAKNSSYYVTDWGNVRFISLDVTIVCVRCREYEFVVRALEEGAAYDKTMVMFLHNPPYSAGGHGSDLQLRSVLAPLAKKYGVELVVTGHDHHYERTKPIDGTTYIVSGSAGAPIRPVEPEDFTASARTEPHYVLIDADGDKLAIRSVNLRGEVFDSTTIPPNPPGGPPPPPPGEPK
ncbi:MAG: metallophosphoesterase [Deltaproteobacteria bacterium]|nr:metallophosphoesterase [Deltaproteobacteria bacterium]